jgi:hypothetical protein
LSVQTKTRNRLAAGRDALGRRAAVHASQR